MGRRLPFAVAVAGVASFSLVVFVGRFSLQQQGGDVRIEEPSPADSVLESCTVLLEPSLAGSVGSNAKGASAPASASNAESAADDGPPTADVSADDGPTSTIAGRPETSEERAERQVNRFCRETDKWTRPRRISAEDVRNFAHQFAALPKARKREALHRALNVIPDANVALLSGLLFDKSQPKEIVREVFQDIVNRSEEVKEPIVKAVYNDKTHPCCSDAEWIFEVTGEKPE